MYGEITPLFKTLNKMLIKIIRFTGLKYEISCAIKFSFRIHKALDPQTTIKVCFLLREPGVNPGRTRRCVWGRKPHKVTVMQVLCNVAAREDAVSRSIHKPEYLIERHE